MGGTSVHQNLKSIRLMVNLTECSKTTFIAFRGSCLAS